jgi:hypothetical protein
MSKKISELTTATTVTVDDLLQVVDVEDTTMAVSGTNKKITARTLGNNLPVTATGSSASRSLKDRFADTVNVKDFGAVGDGVADDTAAIQAAIDSGAEKVIATKGIYRITNTLSIVTAKSFELDFNNFTLHLDDSTGLKSHIKLGNGITQQYSKLENIVFTRQQVATSGYAIDSDFIGVTNITGCRIYGNNKIHGGIKIYRGIIIAICDNYIDNCINHSIYLEGSGAGANKTTDVIIRDNRIDGSVNALNSWDFTEGVFCRGNIFYGTTGYAVTANASSNANGLVSFKFEGNDFDTSGGGGLYLDNISNIVVADCWFSSNTLDDIQIKSNVDSCIISSNQFYPTNSGIRIEGINSVITSNLISGGQTSIELLNSASNTSINGNSFQGAQNAVQLATAQNTHLVGNLISGVIGTISGNGGTGTVIQNNKGDSAVGTNAYITVGSSPFTYTSGSRPEYVSVFSGTVSQINLGANSIGLTSNRDVVLAPNQSVTITYSSIPFMVKNYL